MSFSWLFKIIFLFFFPFRKAQNHTEFSGFVYLFCFSGKKNAILYGKKRPHMQAWDFLTWKLSGKRNAMYLTVRKCRIHFNFKRKKAYANAQRELFMLHFPTNVHGFDSYERLSE